MHEHGSWGGSEPGSPEEAHGMTTARSRLSTQSLPYPTVHGGFLCSHSYEYEYTVLIFYTGGNSNRLN